jgi:5-oxoprolinase (ATP-hydrolysing)
MLPKPRPIWKIAIDRGGTFTDAIGRSPNGKIHLAKVLSDERSPITAIRQLLSAEPNEAGDPPFLEVRLGTTVATNALLEKKGQRNVLLTTRGFADALRIGTQQRPNLFTTCIPPREVLPERIGEAQERMDAQGRVVKELLEQETLELLREWRRLGYESLAVHFMHACINPAHELKVEMWARELGFQHVALSHRCDPAPGFIPRGETACADAYLTPVLQAQLKSLSGEFPHSRWLCMQSDGALTEIDEFRGPKAILSGPAGGWIACRTLIERLGITQALTFDMGGTSTDVSRCVAYASPVFEAENAIAGLRLRAPSVSLETIAAGGGSLCQIKAGRLCVGPESAGSHPGPLCYGRARDPQGPVENGLTVTDINFFLGRLRQENFPFPLCLEPVQSALEKQCDLAQSQGMGHWTPQALALGYRQVVDQAMALALRGTALKRGEDAQAHALVCFGGAGGQHACAVASLLGIRTILIPPLAGIFSAVGISQARQGFSAQRYATPQVLREESSSLIEARWLECRIEAAHSWSTGSTEYRHSLVMRYQGSDQDMSLEVDPKGSPLEWIETFETRHEKWFGYRHRQRAVEWLGVKVDAFLSQENPWPEIPYSGTARPGQVASLQVQAMFRKDQWETIPCVRREDWSPKETLYGPAILLDATGTVVVDPGWAAVMDAEGHLRLRPEKPESDAISDGPAQLALFNAAFMNIATEMGRILQRTAISTNIKDRLDYSCALFDAQGRLIANAPHIPVHLGAMGESVRHILHRFPKMAQGDAYLTNHPEFGGSHLPDLTVIAPVFIQAHDLTDSIPADTQPAPVFFVANRAHHADIGGIEPGSMPAESRRLEEEGLVIDAVQIMKRGELESASILQLFQSGPFPARNPRDNLGDLHAQLAACQSGILALSEFCRHNGLAKVRQQMQALFDNARDQVRKALQQRRIQAIRFQDELDEEGTILVNLSMKDGRLIVDFTGSSAALNSNLNVPNSVVRSCLLYTLRCLVSDDIPLNEGCLEDMDLILPADSLLAPPKGAAIVGGNVETSQRITDVLWGAFGLAAASQGTMNNITFGNEHFGYYETLGGGEGASLGHPGTSAIHTHMTNTRLTDPEILEMRYRVRLNEFSIRRHSGGAGQFAGGDGMVREYHFLEPVRLSLLTQRRTKGPWGFAKGGSGLPGKNLLIRKHGSLPIPLPSKASTTLAAGDAIRIETPGGGGYGAPP